MDEKIYSVLVGLTGLYIIAGIALLFTIVRQMKDVNRKLLVRFTILLLVGVLCQSCHFVEEYLTKFYILFPLLFGLAPWSGTFFLVFNTVWITIWLLSIIGITRSIKAAYFPIWFLIFGLIGNGIIHPLLAIYVQDYFPGLYTSPLVGIIGVVIFYKLIKYTYA